MKKKNRYMKILPLLLAGSLMTGCGGQTAQAPGQGSQNTAFSQNTQPADTEQTTTIAPGAVSPAQPGTGGVPGSRSVTINSSETVSVVPDMAEVVYSVRTERSTAADCQQQNAADTDQVIEQLKSLGVEEKSIQTSDFTMRPIYDYSGRTARVTGYEAETTLTVSDLKIEGLGEMLSASVASGINTVQSITYQASGYDQSYQDALTKAVDMAHRKAETLAAASGSNVGKVITIQETSGYTQARYEDTAAVNALNARKESAMEDAAAVMPGEIDVKASVTVEYELTD